GVVVVATSNTPPDRLYENGLQRALFLPFIALLKQKCEVVEVAGPLDYRRRGLPGRESWHLGEGAHEKLGQELALLTDAAEGKPETLEVNGRKLEVPKAAHGVAWLSFDQLCRQPTGAADFEALASSFPTLIIEGIPTIGPDDRNT